jgi:hypothetical protein
MVPPSGIGDVEEILGHTKVARTINLPSGLSSRFDTRIDGGVVSASVSHRDAVRRGLAAATLAALGCRAPGPTPLPAGAVDLLARFTDVDCRSDTLDLPFLL